MYAEIEQMAQQENCAISDVIEKAFRHYQFTCRWQILRQWGAETASLLDLETDEELERFLEL